ncbi:MAG: N-acetylmuramoyl-L-alanine amidase [bacterium]|nr:MAG: N-acetylmuramoyl-L-alanine amidase [bacterium]
MISTILLTYKFIISYTILTFKIKPEILASSTRFLCLHIITKEEGFPVPNIYLSPSVEENNLYVTGGSEEYYMNLIADAMIPYLGISNIKFTRNNPRDTVEDIIAKSNAGNYDLHLALHSSYGSEQFSGDLQGINVHYYPSNTNSQSLANNISEYLKIIYHNPNLVKVIPNITLDEITKTIAPAVFVELGYHDNSEDAQWIKDNIYGIARRLVLAITEYSGIPFDTF